MDNYSEVNEASFAEHGDLVMQIHPRCFRPAGVETRLRYPKKAGEKLGWVPEIHVQDICAEMVEKDYKSAHRAKMTKDQQLDVLVSLEG